MICILFPTLQVALAKANSAGPTLETLVSQDLSLGEGGPLEANDSAEIRYTGNLLQNNAIGQVRSHGHIYMLYK